MPKQAGRLPEHSQAIRSKTQGERLAAPGRANGFRAVGPAGVLFGHGRAGFPAAGQRGVALKPPAYGNRHRRSRSRRRPAWGRPETSRLRNRHHRSRSRRWRASPIVTPDDSGQVDGQRARR
jgi:hypothetical protein